MIKLHLREPIEDRKEFVGYVSQILNMGNPEPYMTSKGDTSRWSIDPEGNNFWIKFCEENPRNFTISCRYDYQSGYLLSIALVLVNRFDCSVI